MNIKIGERVRKNKNKTIKRFTNDLKYDTIFNRAHAYFYNLILNNTKKLCQIRKPNWKELELTSEGLPSFSFKEND